jgi:hypothetical protein
MTEQKLCKKCCQWVVLNYGPNYYTPPYAHCHHPDPEERPKGKCWCDDPSFQRIYLGGELREIHFCPLCGKPRKNWGK